MAGASRQGLAAIPLPVAGRVRLRDQSLLQAMEEREAALRRAALSYEDAEVVIEIVRELELAGAGATTFAGAHVLSLP